MRLLTLLLIFIASTYAQTSRSNTIYMLQSVGRSFNVALASAFASSEELTFSATGLPAGSGITLSPTGVLSGTPNQVDLAAQPLRFVATATTSKGGSASRPVMITILARVPQADQLLAFFARINSVFSPVNASEVLSFRGSFTATGIPRGSGLAFRQGVLTGTLNDADLSASQPLIINITGVNSAKRRKSLLVVLTVMPPYVPPQQPTQPPAGASTATLNLIQILGQNFTVDLKPVFASLGRAVFSVSGLPAGTGLFMTQTGNFSGKPNARDMAAQPLQLVVTARTNEGQTAQLQLIVSILSSEPKASNVVGLYLLEGTPVGVLNASAAVPSNFKAPIRWSISGLPQNSGFKFNASSGLLTGVPGPSDSGARQPLVLLITFRDSTGKNDTLALVITVLKSAPTAIPTGAPARSTSTTLQANVRSFKLLQIVGSPFSEDLSRQIQGPGVLTYALTGLPTGSGIQLNPSGMLMGSPTSADARAKQPISATLKVTTSSGTSLSIPVYITALADKPKADKLIAFYTHQNDPLGDIDIASQFDLQQPFTISSTGIPRGSGVSLSSRGILSGTTKDVDFKAAQPLRIIVTATKAGAAGAQPQRSTVAVLITVLPVRS